METLSGYGVGRRELIKMMSVCEELKPDGGVEGELMQLFIQSSLTRQE